jgi:hypothetical protein
MFKTTHELQVEHRNLVDMMNRLQAAMPGMGADAIARAHKSAAFIHRELGMIEDELAMADADIPHNPYRTRAAA